MKVLIEHFMSRMWLAFEIEEINTLEYIQTMFKTEGQLLSPKFRENFLNETNKRITDTYDSFVQKFSTLKESVNDCQVSNVPNDDDDGHNESVVEDDAINLDVMFEANKNDNTDNITKINEIENKKKTKNSSKNRKRAAKITNSIKKRKTKCVRSTRRSCARTKKFKCQQCNRTFTSNANLIRHIRIHTGEKPFQCNYCLEKFSRSDHLNNHTKSQH